VKGAQQKGRTSWRKERMLQTGTLGLFATAQRKNRKKLRQKFKFYEHRTLDKKTVEEKKPTIRAQR
jgi:hypothetical protein